MLIVCFTFRYKYDLYFFGSNVSLINANRSTKWALVMPVLITETLLISDFSFIKWVRAMPPASEGLTGLATAGEVTRALLKLPTSVTSASIYTFCKLRR